MRGPARSPESPSLLMTRTRPEETHLLGLRRKRKKRKRRRRRKSRCIIRNIPLYNIKTCKTSKLINPFSLIMTTL